MLALGGASTGYAHTLVEPGSREKQNQSDQAVLYQLFERMISAMKRQNYSGRYFRVRGDQIEVMELTQRHINGVHHEYLRSLNGTPKIIRRVGSDCECIWPEQGEALVGPFPQITSRLSGSRFAGLNKQAPYQLIELGRYRIAGHYCQQIAVVPDDELRYGYKVCIGEEEPLLLRMSIYERQGTPIEHNQFSHIIIDSHQMIATVNESDLFLLGAERLQEEFDVVTLSNQPKVADRIEKPRFGIHNPPKGFEIRSHTRRENPQAQQTFEHIVVSDGLATVSLFIEEQSRSTKRSQRMLEPGVHMAQREFESMHITAIGDVPQKTVNQLIESVAVSYTHLTLPTIYSV